MCLKQHKRAIISLSFEEWIKQVSAVTELGAILVDKQVIPLKTYEGICKHRILVTCMLPCGSEIWNNMFCRWMDPLQSGSDMWSFAKGWECKDPLLHGDIQRHHKQECEAVCGTSDKRSFSARYDEVESSGDHRISWTIWVSTAYIGSYQVGSRGEVSYACFFYTLTVCCL